MGDLNLGGVPKPTNDGNTQVETPAVNNNSLDLDFVGGSATVFGGSESQEVRFGNSSVDYLPGFNRGVGLEGHLNLNNTTNIGPYIYAQKTDGTNVQNIGLDLGNRDNGRQGVGLNFAGDYSNGRSKIKTLARAGVFNDDTRLRYAGLRTTLDEQGLEGSVNVEMPNLFVDAQDVTLGPDLQVSGSVSDIRANVDGYVTDYTRLTSGSAKAGVVAGLGDRLTVRTAYGRNTQPILFEDPANSGRHLPNTVGQVVSGSVRLTNPTNGVYAEVGTTQPVNPGSGLTDEFGLRSQAYHLAAGNNNFEASVGLREDVRSLRAQGVPLEFDKNTFVGLNFTARTDMLYDVVNALGTRSPSR